VGPHTENRIFYGWYIVAVAFMANFMAVGTFFYILNAFMQPLCDLRGWTRTDINGALALGSLFRFISEFIFGTIIPRVGARRLMTAGAFIAGVSFIFLVRVTALTHFYILFTFLCLGCSAYGGIVANTAVNNWFSAKKGKALGIATAGMSLSGAMLPFIAMLLILHIGIQSTSLGIGLAIIITGMAAGFVVRDWPETYGLYPDGEPPSVNYNHGGDTPAPAMALGAMPKRSNSQSKENPCTPFYTPALLFKTPSFWKIGFGFPLLMMGVVGVMSQLKPRFSDIGFSDMTAMGLMSITAFIGAVGKYVSGKLCDRFEPKHVVVWFMFANVAGLGLMFLKGMMPAIILFIIIFGFAMGGIMSTYPIMVADMFGRRSFPAVMRLLALFFILQLGGYIIAGQSFDRFGSYDAAYGIYIVMDLIAAGLILTVKRPQIAEEDGL
jgi:MFS transporter, OFA family, oxalate/formate antiporter